MALQKQKRQTKTTGTASAVEEPSVICSDHANKVCFTISNSLYIRVLIIILSTTRGDPDGLLMQHCTSNVPIMHKNNYGISSITTSSPQVFVAIVCRWAVREMRFVC